MAPWTSVFAYGPPQTITLPNAPPAGSQVIINTDNDSGTSPVTVACTGGATVIGVGIANATSFPLGTLGATVWLLFDGARWEIVSGRQDSVWVTAT